MVGTRQRPSSYTIALQPLTDGRLDARAFTAISAGHRWADDRPSSRGRGPILGWLTSPVLPPAGHCTAPASGAVTARYDFDFVGLTIPNTRDVGLVILDQPIYLPEYGEFAPAGALDGLATGRGTKGTVFTVSGYGLGLRTQEHSANPSVSFRSRLMAKSLVNLRNALTDGFNLWISALSVPAPPRASRSPALCPASH